MDSLPCLVEHGARVANNSRLSGKYRSMGLRMRMALGPINKVAALKK